MRHLSFILVVLFGALTLAANPKAKSLIVGGTDAAPTDFPYIVSFQSTSFNGHFCGGTLIKKNWVLTAAHCADYIADSTVYVGLLNQSKKEASETFTVTKVVVHPKNDPSTQDFDYALVQLSGDSKATPVAINRTEIDIPTDTSKSLIATVAGWGYTQENGGQIPDSLQKVDVPLVAQSVCNTSYPNAITNQMICAGYKDGGKDACQGDSGGPLLTKQADGTLALIGVVSWGQGCARQDFYGVYAKVNSVADWIDATTSAK
jgi:trypsin